MMTNQQFGSSRLNALIDTGKVDPSKTLFLDCYNQSTFEDISPTITTRINSSNHYYISEPTLWQMGYGNDTRPLGPTADNLCPTITASLFQYNNVIILPNDNTMKNKENTDKIIQIGNTTSSAGITIRDNPQRGRTYDPEGLSPALNCMQGGNLQPQIIERVGDRDKEQYSVSDNAFTIPANPMSDRAQMLVEPQSLTRERTDEEKERRRIEGDKGAKFSQGKQYTTRTDGVANTLTTCEKERMIVEPQAIGHYRPEGSPSDLPYSQYESRPNSDGHRDTTAQYAAEPVIQNVKVDYNGEDKDNVLHAAEELQGYVQKRRPNMPIGVDVQEDGHLRPHINNDSNFGIMDYYADHENGTSGTQTATRPTNTYGPTTEYRIRRLTPRECFRLMDVDDKDIDKILNARNEKGKPMISNSKAYALAGNSIVTNCLTLIFERMFIHTSPTRPYQLGLFD